MSETILFLPGLLCDTALWAAQVERFQDRARCVVADMTRDDSLDGMAIRAVSGLPERFAVVGLSMGGYVAMTLMRTMPERITRLALLDTSARPDDDERLAQRGALIDEVAAGGFDAVIEKHFQVFVHPDRLSDAALVDTLRSSARNVGPDAYVRQQRAIMARPDARPGLGDITCPALVLCGAADALTPPELHDEMAGLIPGARQVKIDGAGHLPTLEKPEAVNAALSDWLEWT